VRWLPWGLVLALLALPVLTPAAPKQNEPAGEVMYRYTKPDGTLAVSATLNEQAIHAGYQVLDHNGRVLRREPPAPPEEQARRRQAMAAEQQAQRQAERDKELERLYAGPEDAVRARERQIEALELRISYATNTLAQLEEKRDQEVSLAARAERAGRPVPEGTRQAIEEYQRRMAHVRQEIAGYEKDKQAVREQYAPIIERLEELAGS
jgi:chromosome segregation ATPase|tara:strand:- start:57813 stop:58436 length:624 start_codon:yes stop_codon:yes gene_type:complete